MSELPKCRLCKRPPVIIDETLLFHDTECDCPLWCAEEMSHISWRTLMTQQQSEPVEYQFFDPESGKWHNFINDQHRRNTADAGYEIRALYAAPQAQPAPTNKEHDNAKDSD